MKKSVLRDLWLGNVCEGEHMPLSVEYRRIDNLAEQQRAELARVMPVQHVALLEAYTDTVYQLSAVFGEDAFVRGVRFGVRFACEALEDEREKRKDG